MSRLSELLKYLQIIDKDKSYSVITAHDYKNDNTIILVLINNEYIVTDIRHGILTVDELEEFIKF